MHAHPTRTLLILLTALLAVGVLTSVFGMNFIARQQPVVASDPATDVPALKSSDYVSAQKGFQYLISYTDQGFTPKTLLVKKGETVRFTNNSDAPLQLSLTGTSLLAHGEYLEYTFVQSATINDGTTGIMQVTVN